MQSKTRFGFALEYVKDIERATRFYVDTLGLEVKRSHPAYVEFENFAIATDDSLSGRDEPELYWLVDDIDLAYETVARQSSVVSPLREMPFGSLFSVDDPDGRPRYILELARVRPSVAVGS